MHPDFFTFLAILAFAISLFYASDKLLRQESGFLAISTGSVLITIGTFLDSIEHIPVVDRVMPILSTNTFNWIIVAGFIAPGAALISWGVLKWVPNVGRMASEIKRRKQTETRLQKSEERARALIDFAPEAITIIDAQTSIYVEANPAAEELHGYSRTELVDNMSPWELSPKHQSDGRLSAAVATENLKDALGGGTPRFEWVHIHRDGHEQLCEISLARLPGNQDNHIRASVVDITQRKKTEDALRRSQKLEALAVLSGGAAHDFNNQLAIIQGSAEQIDEETTLNKELVEAILRSVARSAKLTRRLLTFARQQPTTEVRVDVDQVLCALIGDLKRTLGSSIDVMCRSDPGLWQTITDESQLEDALLNLALNARDAMPTGGQLILDARNVSVDAATASSFDGASSGDFVMIAVSDTGSGIEKDDLPRVFEPFFTTKGPDKGSGLGLASVFGFATNSGGFVNVESQPSAGTTFSLYLPKASPVV